MSPTLSNRLIKFLNALPTTKVRVLVSLVMSVYVIVAAVTKNYVPTMEILGFLLISQGIDVSQYMIRQKTVALESAVPTPTPSPTPSKAITPTPEPTPVPTQPNISDLG